MSLVKRITANTLFQILARIATSGASFIITIILARHLGVGAYGDFAKIGAFVSLFYLLADFGLNAIFLQKDDAPLRFKDLFYGRIFLSVALVILVNLLALVLPYNTITSIGFSPSVRLGIALFSLTLITESIVYTTSTVFQQKLTYRHFLIASTISSLFTLFLVGLASLFSYSLMLILGCFVMGGLLKAGLALILTHEEVSFKKVDYSFIHRLMKDTLPVTFMLLANLLYFRLDMLFLAALKPSLDVALYDLAYKFFDFLIALPLFLSNALYPRLLQEIKEKRHLPQHTWKYGAIFLLFSLVVLVPMWVLSPSVSIIKPEFAPSVVPLRLLLLSLPVFFVTSILQWILLAKKQQLFLAWVYVGAAVINIMANVLFIPHFSYVASAIITGVSESIVLILLALKLVLSK